MSTSATHGRLSTFAAAMVIARRDFVAILWSRSFIFFLLGPLFPVLVGGFAGGIGARVQATAASPELGIAMQASDIAALKTAHAQLAPKVGGGLPELVVVKELAPGEKFDAEAAVAGKQGNFAALLTGTLEQPRLTGTAERIAQWQGPVSMLAAQALGRGVHDYPEVALASTASTTADQHHGQVLTAQAGQLLLFLLTMLLAGMVLSNLVEEKGNKIIEVLAAAIPMDAVFLGKLFAMLAVSFVGIACWGLAAGGFALLAGSSAVSLPAPAVGWPLFIALGIVYFALAYLLIGALFLTIGSMAATVREVQTLSMPITFVQLVFFFIASYAVAAPGSIYEMVAIVVPFSSPYAMLARAAQDGSMWPHAAVIAWQLLCIGILIKIGAGLFRKLVMKSGPAGSKGKKRGGARQAKPAAA
ncbi:MAG: ABC transporter permease [Novosphingobium sp.]